VQVAEIIKEDLWPNPLKYFNNVSILFDLMHRFILYSYYAGSLKDLSLQEVEEFEDDDEEVSLSCQFYCFLLQSSDSRKEYC
jgi:hypothetical protein